MIAPYITIDEFCEEFPEVDSCKARKRKKFMNKILPYIAGGIAFIVVLFFVFRKKKRKPAKRRKRKATASRSSSSSPKRKKRSTTTGSRIKKEAGLTTSKPYAEMNARQKQLFNLAKARLARKKAKK